MCPDIYPGPYIKKHVYPRFVLVHFWICTRNDTSLKICSNFTYPIFQKYSRLVISTVKGHCGPELCPNTWELRHIHPYTHFRGWCLHEWTSKATQVHTPCSLGRTPLHSAAESGHLEVGVARFQHKGRRGLQGTSNSKPSACLHACNVWWGTFWGNQLAKQTDMTWIGYHNSEFSATLPAMALLMMIECL